LLVSASIAHGAVYTVRTGQSGGSPGSCGGLDDSFHYYAPNTQCGQPILATPFSPADFDRACAGPYAPVIDAYSPPWVPGLDCDLDARWIASGLVPGSCYGEALSVLYCAGFPSECTTADSIRVCWAVDDFLGDQPSYPGPNPGGVYINGADLGPAFSGPGAGQQYTAVAYNVPLNNGTNSLAVYQRDAGCSVSGLILSATIYTNCNPTPVRLQTWGRVKSLYR
jgi:hypothetical protein